MNVVEKEKPKNHGRWNLGRFIIVMLDDYYQSSQIFEL